MEESGTSVSTLSDLIRRGRPLAAAASLVLNREIPSPQRHKNSGQNRFGMSPFSTSQSPNTQTLKPLKQPTVLVGTLTLPSFADRNSPISCSCFQFSDDSATVCCEVLEFDPKMIGKAIRVLAWNFIPFKCRDKGAKGGFLEIIGWNFHACSNSVCSLSGFGSVCFTLGACGFKDNCKASSLIFGVVESISPVFIVPCAGGGGGSENVRGFLVNVLVCRCKFCSSKHVASELKTLSENYIKDHYFGETVILYFSGLASSWHPVVSRFIGDIVLLTGLKKKLVFITTNESRLMYVTTDEVSLHIAKLFKEQGLHNADIRGKCEDGSYTGVITGVYMRGMVVELDQDVILLLTDQHVTVPHCIRVGAIVTIKNVHFVDPKFPWGKILILGACYRTSMYMESFSPLETGCHLKTRSQSRLQKFIDSLPFAARLWALLVISNFRKKFAGILSDQEILGSKHSSSKLVSKMARCSQKEGLAQEYVTWHLPPSAFQFRRGVLEEFCKHDLCYRDRDGHYSHLRLVPPIADLISYCESLWTANHEDENYLTSFVGGINQKRPLSCGGRSYFQSMRRALRSEEIGVLLLGTVKISLMSARLQLVDATGGIDIMLDLPATWSFDRIFEAKDFTLVIEGMRPKLVELDSSIYQPLSCRNMFSNSLSSRKMETSIYVCHSLTDGDSRSRSLFFDWKGNYQRLDHGEFHLLVLTHKFPVHPKFQGDPAKMSNLFAEAIILPWDLLVTGKCEDAVMGIPSSAEHWIDSLENFNAKCLSKKRCKIGKGSVEASHGLRSSGNGSSVHWNSCTENSFSSSHLLEVPCLIASKGVNFHWLGFLRCNSGHTKTNSDCEAPRQKVLLEFGRDSFCTYEALKIGYYYLFRHQKDDILCSTKENYQISHPKVFISSSTYLWSLTLSSIESLKHSDASDTLSDGKLHNGNNEVLPKEGWQFEIPFPTCNGIDVEIFADNKVFVPSSALNFLKKVFLISGGDPVGPRDSLEGESDFPDHNDSVVNVSTQSFGNSFSDYPLPKGNLITLHGLVVAFHDVNGDAFPAPLRPTRGDSYLPTFLQGDHVVCIHVLVDDETVRIFCNRSKQHYPVGLGKAAYATFHRVLVLGEQNCYMMMPVSFITINNVNSVNEHLGGKFNCSSGNVGSPSVAYSNTVPAALISDALQISELNKPMQFCCRVVGVYVLVLEKAGASSSVLSIPSSGVPLVGLFMDDGSSSCCCWANSEAAATLLQLESRESLPEYPVETFSSSKAAARLPYTSTAGNLNKILGHHGRIVVKNCGPVLDPLCQELAFFVDSDGLLSSSDEDLIRNIINNAIVSTSWTISGSIMDPETTLWVEERLTELDMAIPPLPNIWTTNVCHTDVLTEARSIMRDLSLTAGNL